MQALTVLREALSNVARHAGATRADVTVDVDSDGTLTVLVTDNGTGIPPEGRRSGLRNLADRAAKFGGELRLEPADPGAANPGTQAGVAGPGRRPVRLDTKPEVPSGLPEFLPHRGVRDVADDLLRLAGRVVAPDHGGALLADDEAVLEGRHRPVEPGHHGGHVRLGVPRRQRDDRLAAWRSAARRPRSRSARRTRSGSAR